MSLTHNIVESLRVYGRDGLPKGGEITGRVRLVAGNGIGLSVEDDGITVRVDPSNVVHDTESYSKYQDILNGAGGYSGPPYYMARMGGASPVDGNLFLLGSATGQIGLFADGVHPGGDPCWHDEDEEDGDECHGRSVDGHGLHVFDMGLPDVDCGEFEKLYGHLETIKAFLDDAREKSEGDPSTDGSRYGVLRQFEGMMHLWHHMATQTSVRVRMEFKTSTMEAYLAIATSYSNIGPAELPAGVFCSMVLTGPAGGFDKLSVVNGPAMTHAGLGTTRAKSTATGKLASGETAYVAAKYSFSADIAANQTAALRVEWWNLHASAFLTRDLTIKLSPWERPVATL